MTWAIALIAVSLGLAGLSWWSQRRLLARPRAIPPSSPPPVSILKPLKGADAGLELNLESFFALDYSDYELVFGVQEPDDPALDVVRRVAARHPQVTTSIVVDARTVGLNPKVNNLANILRAARHEVVLISDSNVRVRPGYLADLVGHLHRPDVGLVTSPIRATQASGPGGLLEALQLNTFVMGGVAAMGDVLGLPCVVGKSMLLRRSDLDAIGGLRFLGGFLAEDQVCGEEIQRLGRRVVLSSEPVDNVLGRLDLRAFVHRHLRWARIRRRINPLGYAGEVLLNPVALAAVGLPLAPGAATGLIAAVALIVMSALGASAERRLGVRRPLAVYPLLEATRSLLVAGLWVVPFLSCSVTWRGHRLRIGKRTALEPSLDGAALGHPESDAAAMSLPWRPTA